MTVAVSEFPSQSSIVEQDETRPERREPFYASKAFLVWVQQSLIPRVQVGTQILLTPNDSALVNQHAAIATTPLPLGALPAGTYRVSYYARKTVIDGVSSALTVVLGWSESGVAQILSGAVMATDTTTSPQSGAIVVTIDNNSPLTYATVYASNTPGQMGYKLEFSVEQIA